MACDLNAIQFVLMLIGAISLGIPLGLILVTIISATAYTIIYTLVVAAINIYRRL